MAFLALLAERKINNLRVFNTPLEFDSVPGHHHYQRELHDFTDFFPTEGLKIITEFAP